MNVIIYDLEATCWEGNLKHFHQEIIEIGAYKLNEYGEIEDKFNQFIQPVLHPYLSSFCTTLTSIQQNDVNKAKKFPIVLEAFESWIDIQEADYRLISWGALDQILFEDNCKINNINFEWMKGKFVDLKEMYRKLKNKNVAPGFATALKIEKLEFVGTPHRAIYDAANLISIYTKYIDYWSL